MRKIDARLIGGLLLVGAGLIYLLQNLGYLHWTAIVWGAAAGVAGLLFVALVISNRQHWWAIIPGLTLLAVAGIFGLDYFAPALRTHWSGPLFLAAIGLSFWIIYALDRARWWAIIPGGVLLTLAAVSGLDRENAPLLGAVFLLGLGGTFLLVAILPNPHGPMRWAFIPATVLLVLGVLVWVGYAGAFSYFWPVALIVGGGWLVLRAFRRQA